MRPDSRHTAKPVPADTATGSRPQFRWGRDEFPPRPKSVRFWSVPTQGDFSGEAQAGEPALQPARGKLELKQQVNRQRALLLAVLVLCGLGFLAGTLWWWLNRGLD
jgi:hypothetical protein